MTSSAVETIDHSSTQRSNPYEDEAERARHLDMIASIAHEMNRSVAEVTDRYEPILDNLKKNSRVHDYLFVFVARKVAEQLRSVH